MLSGLPDYVHEAVLRVYVEGASAGGLRPAELSELIAPWLSDIGKRAFYRQIADYDEAYLVTNEERLGELACPARVIWGAADTWIPAQTGRRLAALMPDADFVELPTRVISCRTTPQSSS